MENLKSSYIPNKAARAGSGHISKKKEETLVRTSYRVPESMLKRMRVYSALNGISLTDIVIEALGDWLDAHEK